MPKEMPGAQHHRLRLELVKLKTDIENEAPELEPVYRDAIERSVASAKSCDISEAISNYEFANSISHVIAKRLGLVEIVKLNKFDTIERLTKAAIVEQLIMNCSCKLKEVKDEDS